MDKTPHQQIGSGFAAGSLSIAAVERDTGLSKDTLRVWERRYGFPAPSRDANGERCYGPDDLDKLRLLKRLIDAGHRPGRIVGLPADALRERLDRPLPSGPAPASASAAAADAPDAVQGLLALLRHHQPGALRSRLASLLAKMGLARFVTEVVAPLNRRVGEAWFSGELEVFEEHLYTEAVQSVLRHAIAAIPEPALESAPRVLLTTVPGEPHGLGLLMAEAMFAIEGCRCQSLGVQTPIDDIAAAARVQRADIVALSFSPCPSPRQVHSDLTELRARLPAAVRLWAGGSAPALRRKAVAGIEVVESLTGIAARLSCAAGP